MASNKNKTRKVRPASADSDEASILWVEVANTVKRQPSSRIPPVALPENAQKKHAQKKHLLAKKTSASANKAVNLRKIADLKMDTVNAGLVTGPANLSQPVMQVSTVVLPKNYSKAKWRSKPELTYMG